MILVPEYLKVSFETHSMVKKCAQNCCLHTLGRIRKILKENRILVNYLCNGYQFGMGMKLLHSNEVYEIHFTAIARANLSL